MRVRQVDHLRAPAAQAGGERHRGLGGHGEQRDVGGGRHRLLGPHQAERPVRRRPAGQLRERLAGVGVARRGDQRDVRVEREQLGELDAGVPGGSEQGDARMHDVHTYAQSLADMQGMLCAHARFFCFIARSISRLSSASFLVARLSCCFLWVTSPSSTLTCGPLK